MDKPSKSCLTPSTLNAVNQILLRPPRELTTVRSHFRILALNGVDHTQDETTAAPKLVTKVTTETLMIKMKLTQHSLHFNFEYPL
jgi:hypothetical protein